MRSWRDRSPALSSLHTPLPPDGLAIESSLNGEFQGMNTMIYPHDRIFGTSHVWRYTENMNMCGRRTRDLGYHHNFTRVGSIDLAILSSGCFRCFWENTLT
jgi:hypothetical protein